MLDRTSHISRCISWLQFPLALLVILMHTDVTYDHSDPSSVLNAFLCWPMPAAALPAFFFISGYLFFAGRDTFAWKDYGHAMRKKFFTLLLPYLLWISIAYLSTIFIQGADHAPEPTDIRNIYWDGRPIQPEHSLFGYTFHMFGMPGGFGVMWFVRDLMVMMLFTPLIWMIGKTLGKLAIFLILIAIITHSGIPGFGIRGPWYFILGSLFAICNIDFMPVLRRFGRPIIALWLVMCLVFGWMVWSFDLHHLLNGPLSTIFRDCTALVGVFALFAMASYALSDKRFDRVNRLLLFLSPTSFFMYVVHPLPVIELLGHVTDFLITDPRWQLTAAFFWFIAVRLTLIPAIYFLMLRFCPKTLDLITGRRTIRISTSSSSTLSEDCAE